MTTAYAARPTVPTKTDTTLNTRPRLYPTSVRTSWATVLEVIAQCALGSARAGSYHRPNLLVISVDALPGLERSHLASYVKVPISVSGEPRTMLSVPYAMFVTRLKSRRVRHLAFEGCGVVGVSWSIPENSIHAVPRTPIELPSFEM